MLIMVHGCDYTGMPSMRPFTVCRLHLISAVPRVKAHVPCNTCTCASRLLFSTHLADAVCTDMLSCWRLPVCGGLPVPQDGYSPLEHAASWDHVELVVLLLAAGANPRCCEKVSGTRWNLAALPATCVSTCLACRYRSELLRGVPHAAIAAVPHGSFVRASVTDSS